VEVEDLRPKGASWQVQLHEKGGKHHATPCHHSLAEILRAYIDAAGIGDDRKGWLFRTNAGHNAMALANAPMSQADAWRMILMEVPAAAEVAAAEAAEVAAAKAAHVPAAKAAAEAAHVAEVSAGEMAATELAAAEAAHVAKVSAGEMTAAELAAAEAAHVAEMIAAVEMSPVAVESEATVETVVKAVVKAVMEAAASEEDRTTKPVAIVVIRIGVAVTIVVAGAIIRPIVVVAVRIAGGDAADHSGRDGIVAIAVNVAVSVSPNVVVMADVVTRDIPVNAMCDPRMGRVPVMVSDRRRICGRNRRR
jgi:hypothetical protein